MTNMNQKLFSWFLNENDPRFSDWLFKYLNKKYPLTYNDPSANRQTLLKYLGANISYKADAESVKKIRNIKSAWNSYCRNHDKNNKSQICVYLSLQSIKKLNELSKESSRGKILDQIIYEYYDLQKRNVPINNANIKALEAEVKSLKKTINEIRKTLIFEKQTNGIGIASKDREIEDLKNAILELQLQQRQDF